MVKSTRFAATVWSAVALSTVLGVSRHRHAAEPTPPHRQTVPAVIWHFDSLTPGQPPAGFVFGRTGGGRVGRWIVQSAPDAPSPPNVLAQVDSDRTDYRFPVAAAPSPAFTDGSVSVRCKPVSGRVDRACGVVFRYQDENNYYLSRANALEDNVRFYYVKNGRRIQLANWTGKVKSGVWHELRIDFQADRRARPHVQWSRPCRRLDQGRLVHLVRRPHREAAWALAPCARCRVTGGCYSSRG